MVYGCKKWVFIVILSAGFLPWALSCAGGGGAAQTPGPGTGGSPIMPAVVRIVSPSSGATLSGDFPVIVEANDGYGNPPSRVDLFVGARLYHMVQYENSHIYIYHLNTGDLPSPQEITLRVEAYGAGGSRIVPQDPQGSTLTVNVLPPPPSGGEVNHPPVIVNAGVGGQYLKDYSGVAPLMVNFQASATDPDNDTLSYYWDFGFGGNSAVTSTPSVSFTYPVQGTYTAIVFVRDSRGLNSSPSPPITIRVNTQLPPVASILASLNPNGPFSPNPISGKGTPTLTVYFRAVASDPDGGNIQSYLWDFGDGSRATETDPDSSHTYNLGTYIATLQVVDDENMTSSMANLLVQVGMASPPRVNARASLDRISYSDGPISADIGQTVWFTATAVDDDGIVVQATYNFGDGTPPQTFTAPPYDTSHTFTEVKSYTVTFTALDNDGAMGRDDVVVNVGNPVPPKVTGLACSGGGGLTLTATADPPSAQYTNSPVTVNFSASASITGGGITCQWIDTPNEDEYKVERQIPPGGWTEIASLPANTTQYTDNNLPPANQYLYRVTAWNSFGAGPPSDPYTVSTSSGSLTYTWNFGDGTPNGTGQTVSHQYTGIGPNYRVRLTVTDAQNNTFTKDLVVVITDLPVLEWPDVAPPWGPDNSPDGKLNRNRSAGGQVKVDDFRGSVLHINFWGYWCYWCLVEFPHLQTVYNEQKANGYEIVAISFYESVDDSEYFINRDPDPGSDPPNGGKKYTFIWAHDTPESSNTRADTYRRYRSKYAKSTGISAPWSYFLDRNGYVRYYQEGAFTSPDALRQILARLVPFHQ